MLPLAAFGSFFFCATSSATLEGCYPFPDPDKYSCNTALVAVAVLVPSLKSYSCHQVDEEHSSLCASHSSFELI